MIYSLAFVFNAWPESLELVPKQLDKSLRPRIGITLYNDTASYLSLAIKVSPANFDAQVVLPPYRGLFVGGLQTSEGAKNLSVIAPRGRAMSRVNSLVSILREIDHHRLSPLVSTSPDVEAYDRRQYGGQPYANIVLEFVEEIDIRVKGMGK